MDAPDPSAWRGVEVVRALAGGARNAVFLARRGDEQLVLRTSRRSADSLDWELDLIEGLRGAGVAVPQTVPTDDGRRRHGGVLLQRYVDGRAPSDRRDWVRVVDALAAMHEVTRGWPQRPGFRSARELLQVEVGGDVDLGLMPADAVALVRQAWQPLTGLPQGAIHADLGPGNVLIDGRTAVLIDWDEARVDALAFDFAHLPADVPIPASLDRRTLATAGIAWEAATCWSIEPAYAARRLAELRTRFR